MATAEHTPHRRMLALGVLVGALTGWFALLVVDTIDSLSTAHGLARLSLMIIVPLAAGLPLVASSRSARGRDFGRGMALGGPTLVLLELGLTFVGWTFLALFGSAT